MNTKWGERCVSAYFVFKYHFFPYGLHFGLLVNTIICYFSKFITSIVFTYYAIVHGAGLVVFPMLLLVVDWFIRAFGIFGFKLDVINLKLVCSDVVLLEFKRNNKHFKPGDYVYIIIPAISILSHHPFSIASAPHEDTVKIYIKAQFQIAYIYDHQVEMKLHGNLGYKRLFIYCLCTIMAQKCVKFDFVFGLWTRKLRDFVKIKRSDPEWYKKLSIFVEGAFGYNQVLYSDINGYNKYKHIMYICGGIGITPMYSILVILLHNYYQMKMKN